MSHHDHGAHGHHHPPPRPRKGVHKDWRVWLVIGLMLLAMVIYIMTLDESRRPW